MTTRVKAFFVWICSARDQPHVFAQMKAMLAQPVIIHGQTRQPQLRKVCP